MTSSGERKKSHRNFMHKFLETVQLEDQRREGVLTIMVDLSGTECKNEK